MTTVKLEVPKQLRLDLQDLSDEPTEVLSLDPPTEIMRLPKSDDGAEAGDEAEADEAGVEDPILLDDDELDFADTQPVLIERIASAVADPSEAESERPRWLERLRRSAAAQLALLSLLGLVVVLFIFDGSDGAESRARPVEAPGSFPTIEIEGAPPVTEEDIERRLRLPPKEAERSHDEIRQELKEIAALGREAAGVEALPERRAPRSHRGGQRRKLDEVGRIADDVRRNPEPRLARRFYAPGGTMKIEGADTEEKKNLLPLPVGARLHAKLEVGISSGHPTPVLARLTKEIRAEGRLVAPKDSLVRGRFQADGDKVYATFAELIAGGESLEFEGYAVDQKVPGLVATRREIGDGDPGGSIVQDTVEVAKGVVRSVAGGSIVGQVAQGVTDGVLPEQEAPKPSTVILEVAAGKRFQIVVTKGGRT